MQLTSERICLKSIPFFIIKLLRYTHVYQFLLNVRRYRKYTVGCFCASNVKFYIWLWIKLMAFSGPMYQVHNTLCWFTAIIRSDKDTLMYKGFPISFTFLHTPMFKSSYFGVRCCLKLSISKCCIYYFVCHPLPHLNFGIKHLTLWQVSVSLRLIW